MEALLDATVRHPSIMPPPELVETTTQDLSAWSKCNPIIQIFSKRQIPAHDIPRIILTPRQYSVKGVIISHLPKDAYSVYDANLVESRRLKELIHELRQVFYNDPIAVSERIGYSPIRMLGWWRKNLKDELDWLTTGGEPLPQINPNDGLLSLPPTMGYENNDECLRQVTQISMALNGRRSHQPIDHHWTNDDLDSLILGDGRHTTTIGVDFEMTGLDPTGDWVLNAGWVKAQPGAGEDHITPIRSVMCGVPESRIALGNPTQVINGITMDEVQDKPPLEADLETQGEILDDLYSHPVMTAHSASIEDQLLEQCVDGYAEARRDGLIKVVDTRLLSTWLDRGNLKTGNSLEEYARRWRTLDPDDVEAHHSLDDAMLMLRTEDRQLAKLSRLGGVVDNAWLE